MYIKRFQNRVAESRYSLPVVGLVVLLFCLMGGMFSDGKWLQFALLALSSFLMMELNNVNALIRIYSRMVSCSYLVLAVMSYFLFEDIRCCILSVCNIAFYQFFFSSYQDKNAVGRIFYAFLMIGLSSIFFVKVLYFVPLLWILMFTNIMSGNARTLIASIMGTLLPYWFIGAYCLMTDDMDSLYMHLLTIYDFMPLADWSGMELSKILTIAFIIVLSVTGMIHFRINNYKDKIRTRMLFEIFSFMNIVIIIFMILQPSYSNELLAMLLVSTSPLIGHYIALTHTLVTNISFYVMLLVALVLTVCNIWMPF